MSEKIDQDANAGILPMAFGSELPPIGQWVSCDDKRYSIGAHGLCDFPEGDTGCKAYYSVGNTTECIPKEQVFDTNITKIIINVRNGTVIGPIGLEK